MTRYTISITKWLPPEMQEQKDVFHRCKELRGKFHGMRFECAEVLQECTEQSISKEHVVAEDALVNVSGYQCVIKAYVIQCNIFSDYCHYATT